MLKIKRLREDVKLPVKAREGDAGFDVFSTKEILIGPGETFKFPLGFALEFDPGNVVLIQEKSGMAVNGILTIGNVIDSGYRGECHVILLNSSKLSSWIKMGQKIAQILLVPCYTGNEIVEVTELSDTERGGDGFGSTGKY
ncbi:dUTP diphosphatase [Patescibacteria group bacterium]|uniref:dUTP diphosphatase n=1 Tax=viral metagenome TaxID=1070528 RepID=A0A6M3M794_9ZZZZ|nr:dUTP diphosphatase [Patescibacteria group bacterium]